MKHIAGGTTLAATICLFLGIIIQQRYANDRTTRSVHATADSTIRVWAASAARRDSLLESGMRLQPWTVVSASGDSLTLDRLAGRYPYMYFYRNDCAPCALIQGLFSTESIASRDSVAFIAYRNSRELAPEAGLHHFAWRGSARHAPRTPILAVPSVIVARSDGRIVSVGHSSVFRVRDVFAMYGVIKMEAIDSVISLSKSQTNIERSLPRLSTK